MQDGKKRVGLGQGHMQQARPQPSCVSVTLAANLAAHLRSAQTWVLPTETATTPLVN